MSGRGQTETERESDVGGEEIIIFYTGDRYDDRLWGDVS